MKLLTDRIKMIKLLLLKKWQRQKNCSRDEIKNDYILSQQFNRELKHLRTKIIFISMFILGSVYISVIQTELYRSASTLIVKDLNENSTQSIGFALLGGSTSTQMQDSKILEAYLSSLDVLEKLDKNFALREHYNSKKQDILQRLYSFSTTEDFLLFYLSRLEVIYDEVSGILTISFLHTDSKIAQDIVNFLIKEAEVQLNQYNHINIAKQLKFVTQETQRSRTNLDKSIANLKAYQDQELSINPLNDAQIKNQILAEVELKLVNKKALYEQYKAYMNEKSFDLITLKNEIIELQHILRDTKRSLSGSSKSDLNTIVLEYEQRKNQVEFDKEVYKQALLQLEKTKIDLQKEAKILTILTHANLPDGYDVPQKPSAILTLFIILILLYSVQTLIISIIKDHKE
jgi:capsular polysaccharide transport system permease protein